MQAELPLELPPRPPTKPRTKPVTRAMKADEQLKDLIGMNPRLVLVVRTLCMSRTGFTAGLVADRSGCVKAQAEHMLRWAVRHDWCKEANSLDRPHPERGRVFYVGQL